MRVCIYKRTVLERERSCNRGREREREREREKKERGSQRAKAGIDPLTLLSLVSLR